MEINRLMLPKGQRMLIRYNEMSKILTFWKSTNECFFLFEAPCQTLQQTLIQLDRALMKAFDRKLSLMHFPHFKKKGSRDSFRITHRFKIKDNCIRLPKIGWIRFFKSQDIIGKQKNINISKKGDHWFFSVQVEQDIDVKPHISNSMVGIDLGVATLATLSNGEKFASIKAFRKSQKMLARLERRLSKKILKSNNWIKHRHKINRLYIKIANIRRDLLHKATHEITQNHGLIVMEDLKTSNMSSSAKGTVEKPGKNIRVKSGLNKAILDQGWYEFRRQLEYKMLWNGGKFTLVSPEYTSQECSKCGYVSSENRTSQEVFHCKACMHNENADVNAAKNILRRGIGVDACGGLNVSFPMKQEPAGNRKKLRPAA